MSSDPIGLPKSFAQPSLAGRNPVSIFIVVDLPQPLEPRKPKISPGAMRKLTSSTATESPNRRGDARPHDHFLMLRPLLLRQQRDERFFERRLTRLVQHFLQRAMGDDLAV